MTDRQLAFRCRDRGGLCDCPAGACGLDRALSEPPPRCERCKRTARLDDRFRLDHQETDDPGVTMQLIELRRVLQDAGAEASWGAELLLYYCETCDIATVQFHHPETP